jgi:hypothetical protein
MRHRRCAVICLQNKKSRDMNGGHHHFLSTVADKRSGNQTAV